MARVPDASELIELVITTDDKPCPVLILKGPTDDEWDSFGRNVSKTISKRHNKTEDITDFPLMKKFVDDHLVGCEDIEVKINGKYVKLDPKKHENWKSLIPAVWKYTAASHFLTGGDAAQVREREEKK